MQNERCQINAKLNELGTDYCHDSMSQPYMLKLNVPQSPKNTEEHRRENVSIYLKVGNTIFRTALVVSVVCVNDMHIDGQHRGANISQEVEFKDVVTPASTASQQGKICITIVSVLSVLTTTITST